MAEMKFGDLQQDERFKSLERALKLAMLKKGSKKESLGNETWTDVASPSISSINQDPFDSSVTGPSLHTSRIGSEIVASSNNLRNILLKKKDAPMNHKTIATSSIKQYRFNGNDNDDRRMMPPPSLNNVLRNAARISKSPAQDVAKSTSIDESDVCLASDIDIDSERDSSLTSRTASNDSQRSTRTFSKWRVMLNPQGQLIIKGTLEGGRIARSKPVIRRLTPITVESIYKHVYRLQGNIVDDRNELPDYVRGKFFNGFPDDWENIYQIWRTFMQRGCPVIFRWPTPVSDSDDDLRSEITDITPAYVKENTALSFSERSSGTLQARNARQIARSRNVEVNDSFSQTNIFGVDGNLLYDVDKVSRGQDTSNKENFKQNNVSASDIDVPKRTNRLTDILKEDKLNVILDNLADKNCSLEYINKIIEMYDCLNYVMSYKSAADEQTTGKELTMANPQFPTSERNTSRNSADCCLSESIPLQSNVRSRQSSESTVLNAEHENTYNTNVALNERKSPQVENDNNQHSDESESETYAGIPKIPMERILRQIEMARPYKHKARRKTSNSNHQRHDVANNYYNINVPPAASYIASLTSKSRAKLNHDDSSVSVTEDEIRFSDLKKSVHPGFRNDRNIPLSDTTAGKVSGNIISIAGQKEKSNVYVQDKHEMQLNLAKENKNLQSTEYNGAYELNVNETIENGITSKQPDTKKMIEASVNEELKRQQRYGYVEVNEKFSPQLKTSKPTVVATVPVNIRLQLHDKHLRMRVNDSKESTIESMSVKQYNEKINNESSIQKVSPSKNTSIEKNRNQMLAIDTERNLAEDTASPVKPVKSNGDTRKQFALNHSENPKTNGYELNRKAKSLTGWTPKVICSSKTDSKFGLVFQGNLLNEAGHVVHKKFTTDIVHRRISPRLIETIDHEVYQLVGDLNDTKHLVPKELLRQCRHGCPSRVEHFCRTWMSTQVDSNNSPEKLYSTSMDLSNITISSKGRKIMPPLSYWTGERIIVKGDQPVYSPGTLIDCSATLHDNPQRNRKRKGSTKEEKNTSKQSNSDESKVTASTSQDQATSTDNTKNDSTLSESNKNKKSASGHNTRTVRKVLCSNDDSDSEGNAPSNKRQRLKPNQHSPSVCNVMANKTSVQSRVVRSTKVNAPLADSLKFMDLRSSMGRYGNGICTYYQDIPFIDDTLSDSQVSHV